MFFCRLLMPFIRTVNITWWYLFFQVLKLLACECKSHCSDHCPCVTSDLKCKDICPCHNCNKTVEIESDVESDDERGESARHAGSCHNDEEDLYCLYLLLMNYKLVSVKYFISDVSLWSFPISLSFVFVKLTFNLREAESQILKHYTFLSLKSKMITLDSVKKLTKTASLRGRVTKYKLCLIHQSTLSINIQP